MDEELDNEKWCDDMPKLEGEIINQTSNIISTNQIQTQFMQIKK